MTLRAVRPTDIYGLTAWATAHRVVKEILLPPRFGKERSMSFAYKTPVRFFRAGVYYFHGHTCYFEDGSENDAG